MQPSNFPAPTYPLYPAKKRRRSRTEVMGQCSSCKDWFSVTLYYARNRWHVQEQARLKVIERPLGQRDIIVHRPDYCNAGVTLYGSQEQFQI
jgi:hypothetical protein